MRAIAQHSPVVLRPQFIDEREELEGGSIRLRLGLSKKDQAKHNAIRIETVYDLDSGGLGLARPIEIIDLLRLTITNSFDVPWSHRPIIEADNAEIIERDARPSIKIDGLPFKTCERVHALCGPDPAADIPALSEALAKTKFSKPKQDLIIAAFEAEAEARQSDMAAVSRLIRLLVMAGETRARARELAASFNPDLGPYQFLFAKRQSFIKADQFAKLYEEGRFRDAERPAAIVVRQLLEKPNIVNQIRDIGGSAWNDFEQPRPATKSAIERLKAPGIIREVDGLIGLAWLVRAEEKIAEFLLNNSANELTSRELQVINYVLDHAGEFLHEPGFELTLEQRSAIIIAFQYRISIVTGPAGIGKTKVIALINAITVMLYADEEIATWVVALAGRAASVAREAGTVWAPSGGIIPLYATTIHRAMGFQCEGDDDGPEAFRANKRIKSGALVLEESSMISSPLMAAVLENSSAKHFIFVGDPRQLPPIGPGKPFQDAIAAGGVPTTRLTKNWRTDCQGIRQLCDDMLTLDQDALLKRFPDYVKAAGVDSCHPIGTNGRRRPR